jgi:hypothetical protein
MKMIRLVLLLWGMILVMMAGMLTVLRREPPQTSPWIIFMTDRNGPVEMYRMYVDGSDQRRRIHSALERTYPQWSPSEKWIIAERYAQNRVNIYRQRVGSREWENLTDNQGNNWLPLWESPLEIPWGGWLNWLAGISLLGLGWWMGNFKLVFSHFRGKIKPSN